MQQLDSRVRLLWLARALVLAAILAGVVAAAGFVLGTPNFGLVAGAVAFVVAFGLGAVHTIFRYRAFGFALESDALVIQCGVVTKVHTVVPYARVQHVDTQRGPIERAVGLSSLVVYTAGSRGADVSIPGLVPDRADDLQNRLRDLAGESGASDAV